MVFTVRSSRSYIKKRAVKRCAELNEGDELVIGATQTLDIPAAVSDQRINSEGGELVCQELRMAEENDEEEECEVDNNAGGQHDKENVTSNVNELTIMDGLITGILV